MKLVYICSPLKGDIPGNIAKAVEYCAYAARQGVIPLAPHTIFTQYLNDAIPAQREQGLRMGIELLKRCDEFWVCGDTISIGMQNEILYAQNHGIPLRYLPDREIGRDSPTVKALHTASLTEKLHAAKQEMKGTERRTIGQVRQAERG